ncbi:hypothetical protein ACKI2N_009425 [Cupriavidus sp. 30B13]|uniref:hypothetical protein n=1 Tax=Cupriavidus sp. 30B13 TaxID=3384241 RepID=UPI003B90B8AE
MNHPLSRPGTTGRASPRPGGHIEQPGEGRKTSQPGERDPQSSQPADRPGSSARHCPQQ